MSYRLVRNFSYVGKKLHRSGWPFVMSCLKQGETRTGVLFDDFLDYTFKIRGAQPYREPWVGILHHPPHPVFKEWHGSCNDMRTNLRGKFMQRSTKYCKGLIALSEHLAGYLRRWLNVPVHVVKHPTGNDGIMWSPEQFFSGDRLLLQLGFYFRNSVLMHQIEKPPMFHGKARITMRHNMQWMSGMDAKCRKHYKIRQESLSPVCQLPFNDDTSEYDRLLSSNVIAMELIDASANNAIIECIVRNTPILINRHPAAVEYLGEDYPLYFNNVSDIVGMFRDDRLMLSAHQYLKQLDKTELTGEFFVEKVRRICRAAH